MNFVAQALFCNFPKICPDFGQNSNLMTSSLQSLKTGCIGSRSRTKPRNFCVQTPSPAVLVGGWHGWSSSCSRCNYRVAGICWTSLYLSWTLCSEPLFSYGSNLISFWGSPWWKSVRATQHLASGRYSSGSRKLDWLLSERASKILEW